MPRSAQTYRLGLACMAGFVAMSCLAWDEPTAGEFVNSCADYWHHEDREGELLCRSYLQGYLAGSDQVIAREELPSPFMQRVLRTKAAGRSERIDVITGSRYCLSGERPIEDLIGKIVKLDESFLRQARTAKGAVEETLERYYRCER